MRKVHHNYIYNHNFFKINFIHLWRLEREKVRAYHLNAVLLSVGQINKNASKNNRRQGCHCIYPKEAWLFLALFVINIKN